MTLRVQNAGRRTGQRCPTGAATRDASRFFRPSRSVLLRPLPEAPPGIPGAERWSAANL